ALLVARRIRNTGAGCSELSAILDGWDGHFTVLMRKRIARHIESCPTCHNDRQRLVSPVALLGATPVFIPAPAYLRERTLDGIRLAPSTGPMATDVAEPGRPRRACCRAARSSLSPRAAGGRIVGGRRRRIARAGDRLAAAEEREHR